MSAKKYAVRLGAGCARKAEEAGLLDLAAGVMPVRRNTVGGVDPDHDHLIFATATRSAARQLRAQALRAFDATVPNKATIEASRRADVVVIGDHPSHVVEVLR